MAQERVGRHWPVTARRILAVALSVGLPVAGPAHAQPEPSGPVVFKRLDTRHGLSHNSVFHVMQDQLGFLWIGTIDGLNRYDGHRFTVFRHNPADSNSLSSSTVRAILEDRHGDLWIRTGAGLDKLDRRSGRVRRYPIQVDALLKEPDGSVLVAGSDGLFRYDEVSDSFLAIVNFPLSTSEDSPSEADPSWDLFRDRRGWHWIGTSRGHLYAITGDGRIHHIRWPSRHSIVAHEDRRGRLWIGHEAGLGLFDPGTGRLTATSGTQAIREAVLAAAVDPDGWVWVGGGALYRMDSTASRADPVPLDPAGTEPLSTPIWTMVVDREGGLWLGTPQGLRYTDPYAKLFEHARHSPSDPSSLSGDVVMALAEAPDRSLWVGTYGAGLNSVHPATGRVRRYRHSEADPSSLCGDQVWALHAEPRGRIWIGTERGLCRTDGGERFERIPLARDPTHPEPVVHVLAADARGRMWAGTTDGLVRLDLRTGRASWVDRVTRDRRGPVIIQGLAFDSSGGLWVGTSWSDLYRIPPDTGGIQHYPLGDALALLGSEGFWAIHPQADGRLLLGSDRGLFTFTIDQGELLPVGPLEGIPAGPVFAIVGDGSTLWVSTGRGLLRHSRPNDIGAPSGASRFYTTADGLPYPEFNRRAALRLADGRLVFGGMEGITYVDPERSLDNPHPPPVVLTGVERLRRDAARTVNPYRLDTLRLAYDDTGLALEFAALTLANPRGASYTYKLDGYDPEWVSAGSQRVVRYPALRPGRYTFRVRASNPDGVWNTAGIAVHVIVPPPWWGTWWFRAATGLISLGLFAAGLRWISTRQLQRRVRRLEMERRIRVERDRIARDLHDTLGSQVSTILAGIELVELNTRKGDGKRTGEYLEALKQDATHSLALLRETVWSLHEDRVVANALADRIQEHLRDRQRYVPSPSLHFQVRGDTATTIPSAHALHLFRVAQEAVNNALRHAGAQNVWVDLDISSDDGVCLTVRDDGTFPEAPGQSGLGLLSMRTRAEECGGSFQWTPGSPSGTVVRVTLPGAGAGS